VRRRVHPKNLRASSFVAPDDPDGTVSRGNVAQKPAEPNMRGIVRFRIDPHEHPIPHAGPNGAFTDGDGRRKLADGDGRGHVRLQVNRGADRLGRGIGWGRRLRSAARGGHEQGEHETRDGWRTRHEHHYVRIQSRRSSGFMAARARDERALRITPAYDARYRRSIRVTESR
jgi:hypothetical protein